MVKRVVFDAYAIMALLENETGSEIVTEIIMDEESEIYISGINLGEIYYILHRRNGKRAAEEVIENIMLEQTIKIHEPMWESIKKAAGIKAKGGLSYADSFALSLAKELEAKLVTGDPEIRTIAAETAVNLIWLS